MRRVSTLILSLSLLIPLSVIAESDRVNTLECSDAEVMAYMDLADPDRNRQMGFGNFEKAYTVTVEEERKIKAAAGEVGTCLGVLYGDISEMAKNVQESLSNMSFGIGNVKEMAASALSEFSQSICDRVELGLSQAEEMIIDQGEEAVDDLYREANRRFGGRAMERYVNEKVLPPSFTSEGLRYRNGGLDTNQFRRKVQSRWRSELEELEDKAIDGATGG